MNLLLQTVNQALCFQILERSPQRIRQKDQILSVEVGFAPWRIKTHNTLRKAVFKHVYMQIFSGDGDDDNNEIG
jgi:hypothetical protein